MDLYRSEHGTAFLDPRGFVELVIAKHSMFTPDEIHAIDAALLAHGVTETPVLLSRINQYAVPADFNILDLSKLGEATVRKVAVYAPSPGDRIFSQLMGLTVFKNVPYRVFSSRDEAIGWLLNAE